MAHVLLQFIHQAVGRLVAGAQYAVDPDDVAAQLVGHADGCGLGDGGVADQSTFDLSRAQPVAADLDHVVDATDHPDVAVLVHTRRVAGQVVAVFLETLPVLADVALRVAVDRARHARPGAFDDQVAVLVGWHRLAVLVYDFNLDAGEGASG